MIKTGPGLTAWSETVYASNTGAVGLGMMRYNVQTYNTEIYDGAQWRSMPATHVDLAPEVRSVLEWAKQAQAREEELVELAKRNTALQDLLRQRADIDQQILLVKNLVS